MADPLSIINPRLARIAGRGASSYGRGYGLSQRREQQEPLDEQEQKSVVEKLRDGSLGTLAATANILDLPGSSVRDVLAGENPFDQWAPWNITSASNRTTGRDLARKWGLARNQDTWGNAIGGFGLEVALDPLTYMTFGGSALGRSGRLAKNAGLMDELPRVAARKAGKKMGDVGKREARTSTTLRDFAQYGTGGKTGTRRKALELIAGGADENEVLGGLVGFGLPFRDPSFVLGNNARGAQWAKRADDVGSRIRYQNVPGTDVRPLDAAARLFDTTIHGAKTKFGQAVARGLFRSKEKGYAIPRLQSANMANRLRDVLGNDVDKYADQMVELAEGVITPEEFRAKYGTELSKDQLDTIQDIAATVGRESQLALQEARAVGGKISELEDEEIQYIHRRLVEQAGHKPKRDRRLLGTYIPASDGRIDFLRDVRGGTTAVRNIVKDSEINDLIEKNADPEVIAAALERKFDVGKGTEGKYLKDEYRSWNSESGKWEDKVGRYEKLAKYLKGVSKETREAGLFRNNLIANHEIRQIAHQDMMRSIETLGDALSQPGILKSRMDPGENGIRIGDLLKGGRTKGDKQIKGVFWGDENEGFGRFLQDRLQQQGSGLGNKKLNELKDLMISEEHADDLMRLMETVKNPEALNEIMQVVDNVTNLSKGLWTSAWPAFHVRNLVSGQFQNAMNGMWDANSTITAAQLLRAKPTRGIKDLEAVQRIWLNRGGTVDGKTKRGAGGPSAGPEVSATRLDEADDAVRQFDEASEAPVDAVDSPLGGKGVVPKNQFERLKQLGIHRKRIENWTKNDIDKILEGGFETLSENHQKLGSFLDTLVKQKGLTKEDADIVKLIYAQSNAQFLPEMVEAHRGRIKTQDNQTFEENTIGLAEFWPRKPDWIPAQSKVHMRSGPNIEPARVLIHELAHIAWYEAERGNSVYRDLIKEWRDLSSKTGTEKFRDWFRSAGDTNPEYHAGRRGPSTKDPPVEQFAEFFSRSIMDRKIPPGAMGGMMVKAMQWLRNMLTKLKSAAGLPKSTRQRLDEIIDKIGGFDESAQMAPVPAPGSTAPPPPKASAPRPAPRRQPLPGPPSGMPPGQPPGGLGSPPGGGPIIPPPNVKNPYPSPPRNPAPLGELTEEEAAKILGELMYANGVIGKFDSQATDVAGIPESGPGTIGDYLKGIMRPDNPSINARRVGRKAIGATPETNLNPLAGRGVSGRTESQFGPMAAGEEIGYAVEAMNRVAPFINLLKKGVSPEEAAKRVGSAQIQYSNRYFTPFEQTYMKRLFPFYSFTSRTVPKVLGELAQHPGGRYAQMLRMQNETQSEGELAPDYVRETASMPVDETNILGRIIGTPPEGTDRYITGLGLMHEDPFSFGPNVRGAGLELLSRTNPLIKAPLEWATGQSFFQKGVDGGRKLDDMDPLVGRILANIAGDERAWDTPVAMEQFLANSPAARALSTARILTDSRKGALARLLPVTTGLRITDVSPRVKDALVRDLLQRAEKDAGASTFERVYFSEEDKARMSPAEREEAERLEAMANVLAQRAKRAKKEREKEEKRQR